MTLCDTDPLVALVDRGDPHHASCVSSLDGLPPDPLLTTWPCFTEAMYLLDRAGGPPAQEELWSYLEDDLLVLHEPGAEEWKRMRILMRRYHDAPMDLADASLVVAAECLGLRRIFTVDGHFRAYRINGTDAFEIVP
ncbi:MAG: type II toxin-antitoxin system VapC family toxin [Rubrobacteraceae bacterium]